MRTVLPDDRSRIPSILIVVLARPVPVRQPGQVTSSDAATSRSGPLRTAFGIFPTGVVAVADGRGMSAPAAAPLPVDRAASADRSG